MEELRGDVDERSPVESVSIMEIARVHSQLQVFYMNHLVTISSYTANCTFPSQRQHQFRPAPPCERKALHAIHQCVSTVTTAQ